MSGTPNDADDFWERRIATHGLDAIRDCRAMRRIEPAVQRLIFLRHGETDGNLQRIYQSADISLNASGRAQAEYAASLLKGADVGRIVASDMRRAWETASIVGDALKMPVQAHAGLRERWFGDFIGTSSINLNWRVDPPNGESANEFVERALPAFEDVLGLSVASDESNDYSADGSNAGSKTENSGSARTLIIAHGGNLYALAFSLGVELRLSMIQNATPLEFNRCGDGWRISELGNDLAQPPRHRNLGW